MNKPQTAGSAPAEIELEQGKTYYFCTCGLSQKQPFCDGAHKGTGFKSLSFSAVKTGKFKLCLCKGTGKAPFCDGSHSRR